MDAEKIERLSDKKALQNLMANARRLERDDVYWLAFKRLCSLEGTNSEDPLERDFLDVLNAYEQLLTEKNGKTTRASRTRQKMKNKGIRQCLEDWATGTPTDGFKLLVEKGLTSLTAEHLVVKYAEQFSDETVASAKERLVGANANGTVSS
jgi:hypothetical protein